MLEKHTLWSKILAELKSDQWSAQCENEDRKLDQTWQEAWFVWGLVLVVTERQPCLGQFPAHLIKELRCFGDTLPIVDKDQKGVFEACSTAEPLCWSMMNIDKWWMPCLLEKTCCQFQCQWIFRVPLNLSRRVPARQRALSGEICWWDQRIFGFQGPWNRHCRLGYYELAWMCWSRCALWAYRNGSICNDLRAGGEGMMTVDEYRRSLEAPPLWVGHPVISEKRDTASALMIAGHEMI